MTYAPQLASWKLIENWLKITYIGMTYIYDLHLFTNENDTLI